MRGAPKGNRNAAKAKWCADAMKQAVSDLAPDGTLPSGLKMICKVVATAALAGEQWAFPIIFDRIDGKPMQLIGGDADSPLVFQEIVIRAVDAASDRPA